MGKRNVLPAKENIQARELSPPGPETCMVCQALKSLGIQHFNSFPGNCPAQLNDFWCTLLHRIE